MCSICVLCMSAYFICIIIILLYQYCLVARTVATVAFFLAQCAYRLISNYIHFYIAAQAKLAAVENNVEDDEASNKTEERTTQQVTTTPGELNCMYYCTHLQLTVNVAHLLKKTTMLMTSAIKLYKRVNRIS